MLGFLTKSFRRYSVGLQRKNVKKRKKTVSEKVFLQLTEVRLSTISREENAFTTASHSEKI